MASENVRVAVRVRPPVAHEDAHACQLLKADVPRCKLTIDGHSTRSEYTFAAVLDEHATQEDVFKRAGVSQAVSSVVAGSHGIVFTYGQTGSGKTYTMEGSEGLNSRRDSGAKASTGAGVVPRAIEQLFELTRADTARAYAVRVASYQLYCERAYDLLDSRGAPASAAAAAPLSQVARVQKQDQVRRAKIAQSAGLRMRWRQQGGFYLENLAECTVHDAADAHALFQHAMTQKVLASHQLNLSSSRSHVVFQLTVESTSLSNPDDVRTAQLMLVDLAGSERQSLTGIKSGSAEQAESISINKSLMTLRQVIVALSSASGRRDGHVPYRNSKLTSLLKEGLGGCGRTVMIACLSCSDECLEDNTSTLEYATMAARIRNVVKINEDPNRKLIRELREQVAFLKKQLSCSSAPALCPSCSGRQASCQEVHSQEVMPSDRSHATILGTGGPPAHVAARRSCAVGAACVDSVGDGLAADVSDGVASTKPGNRRPGAAASSVDSSAQASAGAASQTGTDDAVQLDGTANCQASGPDALDAPARSSLDPVAPATRRECMHASLSRDAQEFAGRRLSAQAVAHSQSAASADDNTDERMDTSLSRDTAAGSAVTAGVKELVGKVLQYAELVRSMRASHRSLSDAHAALRKQYLRASAAAESSQREAAQLASENTELRELGSLLSSVTRAQGLDAVKRPSDLYAVGKAALLELVELRAENELLHDRLHTVLERASADRRGGLGGRSTHADSVKTRPRPQTMSSLPAYPARGARLMPSASLDRGTRAEKGSEIHRYRHEREQVRGSFRLQRAQSDLVGQGRTLRDHIATRGSEAGSRVPSRHGPHMLSGPVLLSTTGGLQPAAGSKVLLLDVSST